MEKAMKVAASLTLLSVVVEAALPQTKFMLPIGGTHISQMAIMFGAAYGLHGLMEALRGWSKK